MTTPSGQPPAEPPPPTSCDGCGVCCHLQHQPPFMPTELDRLPPKLAAEVAAVDDSQGGPCIWLDSNLACRHYEHRPEVCRQFELGGEDCLAMRKHLHPPKYYGVRTTSRGKSES